MKIKLILIIAVFAIALTASCQAQDEPVKKEIIIETTAPAQKPPAPKPKQRLIIKPIGNIFWPQSDYVKDRFGSAWYNIGISVGFSGADKSKPGLNYRADAISRRSSGAHIYIIPIGVSYTVRPANNGKTVPYFGAAGTLSLVEVEDEKNNIDTGFRAKPSGSLFAGVNIGEHINLETNYYAVAKVSDIDLSGLGISLTYIF